MKGSKRQSIFNSNERFDRIPGKPDDNNNEDKITATNDSPESFNGSYLTAYMQTAELERKINGMMSEIFEDYHGCILTVNQNNYANRDIRVDLFFRPRRASVDEKNDTRAFVSTEESVINPNDGAIINAVRRNTATAKRSTAFALTDYAAQILYDFLPDGIKTGRGYGTTVDWRNPVSYAKANLISEAVDSGQLGSQLIYSCITGLDIVKLIGFIYGEKDPDSKSGNIYNITVSRPATDMPSVLGSNWIVSISKMTWADYDKIMQKLGMTPSRGNLPINTTRDE